MTSEVEQAAVFEEEEKVSNLANQALWVCIHVLMAVGSWIAMMALVTMAHPESVPVLVTTVATFAVPFVVGFIFTRIKQNEMAPYTWLIGLIWFLVICLWILDMPTGPNQCYHCDASQKIYLTFFSPYEDSGLIDNQGRLVGTWPAVALAAYGIGSSFALRKRKTAQ
jgi:hypothetical protein